MLTILATLIAAQVQPLTPPPDTDTPTRSESLLAPADPGSSVVELEAKAAPNRSVYKIRLGIDVPVTVAGGIVAAVRFFGTEKIVRRSCPCDPATLNHVDRSVVRYHNRDFQLAADISLGLMIGIPIVLDALDLGFTKPFFEDLMIFIETLSIDTAFQAGTALIAQRPRPASYAGDPAIIDRGEGYASFYAGHVATAFAAMSVVSQTLRYRYGHRFWPWIVTVAAGTSMAFMRMGSGSHFPTDVIVGGLAGLAVGIAVPWLHARAPETQVRIVPSLGGVGVAGRF